jgi:hypothetical protein
MTVKRKIRRNQKFVQGRGNRYSIARRPGHFGGGQAPTPMENGMTNQSKFHFLYNMPKKQYLMTLDSMASATFSIIGEHPGLIERRHVAGCKLYSGESYDWWLLGSGSSRPTSRFA